MKLAACISNALLCIAFIFALSSCSSKTSVTDGSKPSTVHIPLTKIDNQAGAGFCWSYTLHAYVEALVKQRGLEIDLSEEYVGLHYLLLQLQEIINASDPMAALPSLADGYMYGGALQVFSQVGIVPEEFFNIKFENSPSDMAKSVFAAEFANATKLAEYRANPDKLRVKLGEIIGKAIPTPAATFTYAGISYTPKSFMSNKLKFDPADYVVRDLEYQKSGQFNLDTTIIKAALLQKIPVPVAVGVFAGVDNQWNSEACEKGYCYPVGGHAMLAIDFVTENGRGGEMSESEIKQVFQNNLQYLIIKNSWGPNRGVTQEGEASKDETLLGFDVLTRDFVRYSSLVFTSQYLIPKKFVEEKKYLVGYNFTADILMKKAYEEGEKIVVAAGVLDSLTKSDQGVGFSWTLLNEAGNELFKGVGSELQLPELSQGEYKVVLKSGLGLEQHVTTKTLNILKAYDVFKSKMPLKISNNISVDTSGSETVISLNYKDIDALSRSVPMIIEIPEIALQVGEALEFSFVQKLTDSTIAIPTIQAAFDGSDKYMALPCYRSDEEKTITTICSLPTFDIPGTAQKVKVRFYSDFSVSTATKIENNLLVYDFKIKSSRKLDFTGSFSPVAVKFPAGVSDFQQQIIGNDIILQALFSKDIDSAKIYLDGALISESLSSDFGVAENNLLAWSKAITLNKAGYHEVKFVAVKDSLELAFITYKVLLAPKLLVEANKAAVLIGGSKLNLAIDPIFVPVTANTGAISLLFSDLSGEGIPFQIEDNVTARMLVALDLKALENPNLFFAAGLNLETDFDFFRIYASSDAGATFDLLHEFTGGINIETAKPLQLSLLPYAKKDNVLLMLELETDLGTHSELGFIRNLTVK